MNISHWEMLSSHWLVYQIYIRTWTSEQLEYHNIKGLSQVYLRLGSIFKDRIWIFRFLIYSFYSPKMCPFTIYLLSDRDMIQSSLQRPFQEPELEVPTIYTGPKFQGIYLQSLWQIHLDEWDMNGICLDIRFLLFMSGWWLTQPLWKVWVRQLGWLFSIYGKI